MKYREEHGAVVRLEQDKAIVEAVPDQCASGLSCGCGTCSGGPKQFRVPRGDLSVGDHVHIRMPAFLSWAGTFFIFVLPLILFCAGIIVGNSIEVEGIRPDALSLGLGFAGIGVAIVAAVLVDRWLKRRFPPQVERVATAAD